MPLKRMKCLLVICLPSLLLLFSCTTTVTKIKTPEFAAPTDSLLTGLNKLVSCKHFSVDGKEVTINGVPNSNLEIDVINGKDIPESNDGIKTLAHSIAAVIKQFLKDKKEYDSYSVLFVKIEQSSVATKRTWKGHQFKSAEL